MRTVDQHVDAILTTVRPLEPLDLTLLDAHGCVLAEDVVAPWSLPASDQAAVDGYAVRAADVSSASEWSPTTLPVVGDVNASTHGGYSVQPGLSVRIMAGAPMPPGSDAVVPFGDTDRGLATVQVRRASFVGSNVRRAAEDMQAGHVVLTSGTHLGSVQIGLLAAVGRSRVIARPRPRVVVLSTGNELVEPGSQPAPGQVTDSNSYALTTASSEAGATAYRVGTVPDDPRLLLDTIEDQLIRADVILTSGGTSAAAGDVVREVVSRLGNVTFDAVAMQPGGQQGFGTIGPDRIPFFGLPGTPVGSLVSFEVFVRPALRRMLGADSVHRPIVVARALDRLESANGHREYLRCHLEVQDGAYAVRLVAGGRAPNLTGLAHANALAVLDEDVTAIDAGGTVPVMLLERRQR